MGIQAPIFLGFHLFRLTFATILINLPGKFMTNKLDKSVQKYLSELASKGGKARAKKYDKKTLSKWAKLGGRPKKKKGAK
jgi:hypothetical protein